MTVRLRHWWLHQIWRGAAGSGAVARGARGSARDLIGLCLDKDTVHTGVGVVYDEG